MRLLFSSVFCAVLYIALGACPQGLCPSTQTCCNGPVPGQYGCCPQPNAVCCSDGLHCCPHNTVCDLAKGRCDSKKGLIPHVFLFKKDRPVVKREKVTIVNCPGGQYFCPDGNTCCQLTDGTYGCCPYPSAVCCSDKVHCCPSGTTCDSTSTYCNKGQNRYLSLFKTPAFSMMQ